MSSRRRFTSRTAEAPAIAHLRNRDDSRRAQLAATERWRKDRRTALLRSLANDTNGLQWSELLLEVLMEELHVDDSLEHLLGCPLHSLGRSRYPQAIAIALALRHSWRADDFADIVRRLGIVRRRR